MKGSTIPYHLRPNKAIERNIFIELLTRMEWARSINYSKYRYVSFGAAYLEDFKVIHSALEIDDMHCIEMDKHAYSRQRFNNPYRFLELHNETSTNYFSSGGFLPNKSHIIWLDYTSAGQFRQQLEDIYIASRKLSNLDILKFTFNAEYYFFKKSHYKDGRNLKAARPKDIVSYLENDNTYQKYLPNDVNPDNIEPRFADIRRAMGIRAVDRGLAEVGSNLKFYPLAAFTYADGQTMTTLTGILIDTNNAEHIFSETQIRDWKFYQEHKSELVTAFEINVPNMTVPERMAIDKYLPAKDLAKISKELAFYYGIDEDEHRNHLESYIRYYKHLPHFAKVIY